MSLDISQKDKEIKDENKKKKKRKQRAKGIRKHIPESRRLGIRKNPTIGQQLEAALEIEEYFSDEEYGPGGKKPSWLDEVSSDEENEVTKADDFVEKMVLLADMFYQVKLKMDGQTQELDMYEEVLGEVEQASSTISKNLSFCQLIWKIDDFKKKFDQATDGEVTTYFSKPFETHSHGYNLMLSLCPYGDGKGKGKFMSIFFCISKGRHDALLSWPFSHRVTFTLLDQSDKEEVYDIGASFCPNPVRGNLPFLGKPTSARNPSLGLPRFVPHADLWNGHGEFVVNDSIFIKVEVDLTDIQPC